MAARSLIRSTICASYWVSSTSANAFDSCGLAATDGVAGRTAVSEESEADEIGVDGACADIACFVAPGAERATEGDTPVLEGVAPCEFCALFAAPESVDTLACRDTCAEGVEEEGMDLGGIAAWA